jgi:hypothetical protein
LGSGVNQVLAVVRLDVNGALSVQHKQLLDRAATNSLIGRFNHNNAADQLDWGLLDLVLDLVLVLVLVLVLDLDLDLDLDGLLDFVHWLLDGLLDFVHWLLDGFHFCFFFFVMRHVFNTAHLPHLQVVSHLIDATALDFIAVGGFVAGR